MDKALIRRHLAISKIYALRGKIFSRVTEIRVERMQLSLVLSLSKQISIFIDLDRPLCWVFPSEEVCRVSDTNLIRTILRIELSKMRRIGEFLEKVYLMDNRKRIYNYFFINISSSIIVFCVVRT